MDLNFIDALMELYAAAPKDSSTAAARRVAVLVEMELRDLENKGVAITRQALTDAFKRAVKQSTEAA